MSQDVKLLPLFVGLVDHPRLELIKDYARANVDYHAAPLLAENERLRREAARLRRSLNEAVVHGNRQSGKAERMAEALSHSRWCRTCAEDGWESCEDGRNNDALLRDQEGGNG